MVGSQMTVVRNERSTHPQGKCPSLQVRQLEKGTNLANQRGQQIVRRMRGGVVKAKRLRKTKRRQTSNIFLMPSIFNTKEVHRIFKYGTALTSNAKIA